MDIKTEKQTKIICPTCKGNGFYRVPYHQAGEEVHAQCEDCDRTGELVVDEKRHIPIVKGVII
jgi:DnaJ-class molecular chaperone|tara:strand:- start:712 stop:900 length:189 start_codon:yes stop_codon:yes gene_type:complete